MTNATKNDLTFLQLNASAYSECARKWKEWPSAMSIDSKNMEIAKVQVEAAEWSLKAREVYQADHR